VAGLPYLIGNYVDDNINPFFDNCQRYVENKLNRENTGLGFVKYPGKTWDICYVYDNSTAQQGYHYMRRDSNTNTWSQRIGGIITNCFCKNGKVDTTRKITDSNLQQAFQYAGWNGTVAYSTRTQ